MADEPVDSNEGADLDADVRRQNPTGTTTADISNAGSSGSEKRDDDKAQEDLTAEDLEGFVKDKHEQ